MLALLLEEYVCYYRQNRVVRIFFKILGSTGINRFNRFKTSNRRSVITVLIL